MFVQLEPIDAIEKRAMTCTCREVNGSAVCNVGTGPDNNIVVPRPEYADLGRRDLRISLLAGKIVLAHFQPTSRLEVDARAVENEEIAAGQHDLRINRHRFRL